MKPHEFVTAVVKQYQNHRGVFKTHKNAEELAPETDDVTKALFLFYVIQLDYATKSQRLYAGARTLFDQNPTFFTPQVIMKLPETTLREYLQKYLKPRYINEAVNRYQLNSAQLLAEHNGNPLTMFAKETLAKDVLARIKTFRGFGPKIGNFYLRTMINTFSLTYPDIDDILPPVDVHDVRIAFLLGYSESADMTQKNISAVKTLWSDACARAKESWLVFDKALWLLGSEGKPKSKEDIYRLLEL